MQFVSCFVLNSEGPIGFQVVSSIVPKSKLGHWKDLYSKKIVSRMREF